jgi:hypothetical protein
MRSTLHSRAGRRSSRIRRRALFASTTTFLALAALGAPSASALPGGSFFELDGDAVDSAPATNPPYDWSTLQTACGVSTCTLPVVANTGIIDDRPSSQGGTDDTFFQGGGSKDDNDITSWGTGGAGAPDKNELTNAYAVATRDADQDLIVLFGADRFDNSGSAQMGFWLLRTEVDEGTGTNAGKFVNKGTTTLATHQVGDVLVLSDFTNGGQLGSISVYKWVGSGNGDSGSNNVLDLVGSATQSPTKSNPDPANPADCTYTGTTPPANNTLFCATINKSSTSSPWGYESKDPAVPAVQGDPNAFPARSFIEGAVNIGELTQGQCFASFLAETRTAPTIGGAQLKDYALGSFAVCQPSTALRASASRSTVHVGESTTLSFYETNDGNVPLSSVAVTTDTAGCTPAYDSGDANTNNKLDPGETWLFTCSVSFGTSGTKTVTATATGTDPQGNVITYPGDPQERTTVSVAVIDPNTLLTATASALITYTFTEQNTGNAPLSNVSVSIPSGQCDAAPAYVSGDTNTNSLLDTTETWTFRCTKTLAGPTTDTGTATSSVLGTGHGIGTGTTDVTHCDTGEGLPAKRCSSTERDGVTVTITNSARD